MQEMQEQVVTPRGFLSLVNGMYPNEDLKEWTKKNTPQERDSSATLIRRADVLKGIREEQERRKREEEERMLLEAPTRYDLPAIARTTLSNRYSGVGEMPTLYNAPAISKAGPYATEKIPAQVLDEQEEEDDPCVEITASAECYTLALIDEAVERLESTPTLIVVSVLRWLVDGKLLKRWQYHYHGVRIPIVPSDGPCGFDVKVWGSSI